MEQIANNPVTTLSSGINNSVTSLTVTSASAFPSAGPFTIKIDSELLRVTGVSGTTFTVTRAQESTTAASHSSGATVSLIVTANTIQRLFNEMCQVGASSSRPSTVRAGTEYIANDLGNVAWRYDGTNWNLHRPLYVPYANRINVGSWTDLNNTGLTWNDYNGVNFPTVIGSSGDNTRAKYKSLPTAPFTAYLIVGNLPMAQAHTATGIMLYDSGTGKLKNFYLDGYDNGNRWVVENWTNSSTFSSTIAGTGNLWVPTQWAFMKFQDDNTNWIYSFSWDGVNYVKIYSEARNTFLTPTNIGIALYKQSDYLSTAAAPHQLYGYWEQ